MPLVLSLHILVENGSHSVCYHGNGGSGRKKFNMFYLVKTIPLFGQKQATSLEELTGY